MECDKIKMDEEMPNKNDQVRGGEKRLRETGKTSGSQKAEKSELESP